MPPGDPGSWRDWWLIPLVNLGVLSVPDFSGLDMFRLFLDAIDRFQWTYSAPIFSGHNP